MVKRVISGGIKLVGNLYKLVDELNWKIERKGNEKVELSRQWI